MPLARRAQARRGGLFDLNALSQPTRHAIKDQNFVRISHNRKPIGALREGDGLCATGQFYVCGQFWWTVIEADDNQRNDQ